MKFFRAKVRISLRGYLLYCIPAIVSVPLGYPDSIQSLALGLSVGVASALLVGLLALIAKEMSQAIERDFTILSLALFGFAAGLVRGVLIFELGQIIENPFEISLALRVARSAITTCFWFTVGAYAAYASERFAKTYQALQSQLAMQVGFDTKGSAGGALAESLETITRNLQSIGADSRNHGLSNESLKLAAVRLRHEVQNVIRPVSHSLWLKYNWIVPKVKFTLILRNLFTDFDVNIWRVVITAVVLNLIGSLGTFPLDRNLLNLVSVALLALLLFIHKSARDYIQDRFKLAFDVFSLATMSLVPIILTDIFVQSFGFSSNLFPATSLLILFPLVIALIILADVMLSLVAKDRAQILERLRGRIRDLQEASSGSVAGYLHNNLQSELTGLALQLESGSQNPTSPGTIAAWERLGALINKSIADDFRDLGTKTESRFLGLVDAWAGIAELTLELDPKLWEDQQLASLALQIAEESVSNSVRHLEASQIAITVSIAKQNIMVVETNGTQQIGGSAGMGSAWLQEVSLPGGKFETLPEGTRLTIMM